MDVSRAEVYRLLADEQLIGEVIARAVDDPNVLEELASDLSGEIADILKDDPRYQEKIIHAATQGSTLRQRIIKKIVDELS